MAKLTLGIDEAGRGPVLGPMVLAAVCLDTGGARALTRAGLRDSKTYGASDKARAERARLAERVHKRAVQVEIRVVEVGEIDRRVCRGELNALERDVAAALIDRSPTVDRIIADGLTLFSPLTERYPHLVAWNKAESRHAAVAAASVVAKHCRDQIFGQICQRYQPVFGEVRGGGYGNAATRKFIRAYAHKYGTLPPEARRSWPYAYLHDILGEHFDPLAEAQSGADGERGHSAGRRQPGV
ncbi:MAG: hypothetical protein AAGC55_11630 [Myxococcota bacterium]